jgi:hypothetical protein
MEQQESRREGIWAVNDCQAWLDALDSYEQAIADVGGERLVNLDVWYRNTLPGLISERQEPCIYSDELEGIAAWKMRRGVWRERNRYLISQNAPEKVEELSRAAFRSALDVSEADHNRPIKLLSELSGVGPATASAVMAAYAPDKYPFFDELVAAQIPGLGPVAFTARYYANYSRVLRERASALNATCADTQQTRTWTAHDVAQAMWAYAASKSTSGVNESL